MNSIGPFILGMCVGGALVYGSLSYHVLRTDDGVGVVPKLTARFSETYVDIRNFSASDWIRHKSLAAAIVRARKEHLFQDAAVDRIHERVDGLLKEMGQLNGAPPAPR